MSRLINPSMPSPSHTFSRVPKADIQRSKFDRSHGYKTTMDGGYLVPFFVDEVLPGDTFNLQATAFGRLATPLHPIMDNLHLDTFFFFVPNRLVWDNWERFCGEQTSPGASTDFTIPYRRFLGPSVGTLADYFGAPIGHQVDMNVLPFRAYALIWNEWFRDQNLQSSVPISTADGQDGTTSTNLLRRGKRHDYFTSALPWPQKGQSVPLPLGTVAPITGLGIVNNPPVSGPQAVRIAGGDTDTFNPHWNVSGSSPTTSLIVEDDPDFAGYPAIYADLSDATAATINQLRQAFQIQRLLERDARGGTRYVEVLLSHFGVQSPDYRLQRPEYLGGSSNPVGVVPVASTVADSAPQGNLAGVGTVVSRSGFSKSFTEHGHIIGLVSLRADLTYQQGLDRMWSRKTRYDYYWPALAHLGEQAVLNKEIFHQGTSDDDDVFGYQERFAEYRYKPSRITGLFRSDAAGSLDVWHLAQQFGSLPALGPSFISDQPPIDRVIAVKTEPHLLLDCHFKLKCARPMPVFSVPGLIDHF